jgi:hemerythrin
MGNTPWMIEWSDALSMFNPEIDAEHQHFIELVNDLNSEITSQQRDKVNIERILNLILEDAIAHFAHEERLFDEKGYPDIESHTIIHGELLEAFKQAQKDIHNSDFVRVSVDVGIAIKELLVDHVVNEDTKYIEYLRTE